MTAWQTIIYGILMLLGGAVVNVVVTIWVVHWKKRDSVPEELQKEIRQLTKDMVTVRGQIKYIEGRLNGKHWAREN